MKPVTLDNLGLVFDGSRGSAHRLAFAAELCRLADLCNSPTTPHDGALPLDDSGLYVAVDDAISSNFIVYVAVASAVEPSGRLLLGIERHSPHASLFSACMAIADLLCSLGVTLPDWDYHTFVLLERHTVAYGWVPDTTLLRSYGRNQRPSSCDVPGVGLLS